MGVDTLGMRLFHRCLLQSEVPLLLAEGDLLLPYHFVKAEGVLGTVGMHTHLIEVLLMSKLGLRSFSVKVSTCITKKDINSIRFKFD
jgi:hypothetical protein